MKKSFMILSFVILIALVFVLTGCSNKNPEPTDQVAVETTLKTSVQETPTSTDWREIQLKDVRTQESFKISDFDKPILLESFAVWCPTCTRQQKEIKELHEQVGDEIISISLDTDPNEDEEKVLEHIERNDFTWYYVISPKELTLRLIDEFGVSIVNAPLAPMVVICQDQSKTKFLRSGVKSPSELQSEVNQICNQ